MALVQRGDRLAAGERDAGAGQDDADARLINIFSEASQLTLPHRVGPQALSARGLLSEESDRATSEAYETLLDQLRRALLSAIEMAGQDVEALADHMLGAVQTGTTFFPSAFYRDIADISLASHLHLAAAFSGALAAGSAGENPMLIVGDVSGIQPFVHQVASKRAARALRARSFYIQLLSELASRFVARRLDVTPANVISATGGGFTLVGPRQDEAAFTELVAVLEKAVFGAVGPSLSVAIAAAPLGSVEGKDFADTVARARADLAVRKSRRFEASAAAIDLFAPRGNGGPAQACRSCGGDALEGVVDEEGERLCSSCSSLEDLGRRLPSINYVLIEDLKEEVPDPAGAAIDRLAASLGFRVTLTSEPPAAPFTGAILALDEDALERVPCARFFPVGRHVPQREGKNLDFKDIAAAAQGRPLLAVVKADVDDLGLLLQSHFVRGGEKTDSPSRFASFSRMLSLFFEGYINNLAQVEYPDIYMIFSGGDDLLAVGPWDQAMSFMLRVRKDFATWTAGNPDFHFSVGIALGGRARPIVQALDEAEDALKASKSRPGKASVSLMGHEFSWGEFDAIQRWWRAFVDLVRSGGRSGGTARSLLQRLQELEVHDEPGKILYGPHVWRTHYYLARFAARHGVDFDSGVLADIRTELLTIGGPTRIALAARLAEFETQRMEE